MSTSRDKVTRVKILRATFPTCFHIYARKRGKSTVDQVELDDHLLYILTAGDDSDVAQNRTLKRFGRVCPLGSPKELGVSDVHLVYTRNSACFYAFRALLGWDVLGRGAIAGAQYRDLRKPGKVHRNHAYTM